jgi:tetratricopeptide (TPR) repeat protein
MRTVHLIFLLVCISNIFANNDHWIDRGMELTINNKFNEAIGIYQREIKIDADNYKATFYLAAALQAQMTHYENHLTADDFNRAIDKTLEIIESKLDMQKMFTDSQKAELYFYLGSAYGYRASYQGENGKWFKAIGNGKRAKKYLDESILYDSTMYDAYLGIGAYLYWLSSKTKFLIWLPFIGDSRDEGIAMVKKATVSNCRSKYMAMHQLIFILLNYGKHQDAISYAQQVIEKFPESEFMWMAAAHTYYKNKDYQKAEPAYYKLIQLAQSGEKPNPSHLVKYRLKLAQIYYDTKRYHESDRQCDEIILLADNELLSKKAKEDIKKARNIMEKCRKKMK